MGSSTMAGMIQIGLMFEFREVAFNFIESSISNPKWWYLSIIGVWLYLSILRNKGNHRINDLTVDYPTHIRMIRG